jgi:hypothetical protein
MPGGFFVVSLFSIATVFLPSPTLVSRWVLQSKRPRLRFGLHCVDGFGLWDGSRESALRAHESHGGGVHGMHSSKPRLPVSKRQLLERGTEKGIKLGGDAGSEGDKVTNLAAIEDEASSGLW